MFKLTLFVAFLSILFYGSFKLYEAIYEETKITELDLDKYWAEGKKKTPEIAVNRMIISITDENFDQLNKQLNESLNVAPPSLEGSNYEYGFNADHLSEVAKYWKDNYLPRYFKEREFSFSKNKFFMTKIQGLNIKYFHMYPQGIPSHVKVLSLLMLHSWPGSPLEFFDMIPHLTQMNANHQFVFEVIIPFMPGFGMSDAPKKKGFDVIQMAILLHNFMNRTHTPQYYIYGGNPGSVIGSAMATLFPENVVGLHVSSCFLHTNLAFTKQLIGSFKPNLFVSSHTEWFYPIDWEGVWKESGFFHLQVIKPDTLGTVLNRNPLGLLAYTLSEYISSFDIDNSKLLNGVLGQYYNLDRILDIITLNYATDAASTAFRFYKESLENLRQLDSIITDVPFGCMRFKDGFSSHSDWILKDKYSKHVHSAYHEKGGHCPSLSLPQILVEDLFIFAQKVEDLFVNKEKLS